SVDEGDNDPSHFLAYLVAALQTIAPNLGAGVLLALQSPQPPPTESILTALLNDIATAPDDFALVLDDYHVVESERVDSALTFLIEHLPPQMHVVIATREDPHLPLAQLRARGQLTELRAADLRFTPTEAAEFLNHVMGLNLSAEDVSALETRTEGWIVGLQLAAISMRGLQDTPGFIKSFTGSHHFVLDYLLEEVLHQQSENVQNFLLRTSILNRLCGPLCDAVLLDASVSGQDTLEYLERANLFIVPLDDERRWYRYHHLFAELLRQRLHFLNVSPAKGDGAEIAELHSRASQWFEDNGLDIEAFHHAAAANDIDRAERLMDGKGIPLHMRGAVIALLDWLGSLPTAVLNARPTLWWRYGALLLINGQTTGVEEKLEAAEAALKNSGAPDQSQHLVGRIATARAVLALTRYQAEPMLVQSRRALEYLPPDDLTLRANATWTLGFAYQLQGERAAASQAYTESIAISQPSGNIFFTILATIGLGNMQEADNQLYLAAETYGRILQLAGDQPLQVIHEAQLGLARIHYEWNDLDAAERYGRESLKLARQYDTVIDRFIVCEVFLARLKLAQGDVAGATTILAQANQSARQKNFVFRIPEVAAAQVLVLIRQGNLAAADQLAHSHDLPMSQVRVYLAQGDPSAALAVLEPLRAQVEVRHWKDEQIRVMTVEALAHHARGDEDRAVQVLGDALALAEPGGFIRSFVDEGLPMAQLLSEAVARGIMPDYVGKLLAAFDAEAHKRGAVAELAPAPPLLDPLSQREVEVLQLIAQGLSNHEIGERLFLALDTVKGHNRRIYEKLQVQRRTEAVARARELGLL
ncbi:MAG TPA: LuxR C-terminal-related transcriptional regulator, partial [Aggregatilineales bacterium]|nr:LuxR C-terminal-related transcriptional regulator [Aggregatilineales bacterium]